MFPEAVVDRQVGPANICGPQISGSASPRALTAEGLDKPLGRAVKQSDGTTQKTDHGWLLLIQQDFGIGEASGANNRYMGLVVADAAGAFLLPVFGRSTLRKPKRIITTTWFQVNTKFS